jgi:SAM-dependent methyltransferase
MVARSRSAPGGADLARYYDLDLLDDPGDVDMYLALAAAHDGPVLELASGSGRICVALAAAGHDVTGVDRDPDMLGRARAAWQRLQDGDRGVVAGGSLELIERDIDGLRLKRRFSLVILAFDTLLVLGDRAAQQAALEVMARHLAPGGRALIDVWLPSPDDLALYDGRAVLDWVRRDRETDEWVAKTSSARYNSATQTATVTTFFDVWRPDATLRRTMRVDGIRFIAVSELALLAECAGLAVDVLAQDYQMTPLSDDGERLVLVARAQRQPG